MNKAVVNTFTDGMNKDVDKSMFSNKSYVDAQNFRMITSKGLSTGALETIKGNKLIDTLATANQQIIGSCELRDKIILFTTDNTTAVPIAGRSMILSLEVDLETESLDGVISILYDDSLNTDGSYLLFSTANPIKAIGKYETPNIQKVYWTDGFNNLRYCNIAKNLTTDGTIYVVNNYMAVDKFEFLPKFDMSKPVLNSIVSGNVQTGVAQYSYQLYQLNGSETAFSVPSDIIHVTSDNDSMTNTLYYTGDKEPISSGKGFKIQIDNTGVIGFDRLRLVRIYYSTLNALPVITICSEIEILTTGGIVYATDTGDTLGELTIDEFNISSTELFSCKDIATKDNILFTSNITKTEFDVDFDCRAVRFRNYVDPITGVTLHSGITYDINADVTQYATVTNPARDDTLIVTIPDFSSYVGLAPGNYITNVNSVSYTGAGTVATGHYLDSLSAQQGFTIISDHYLITYVSFSGDTLTFTIQDTFADIVTDFIEWDTIFANPVTLSLVTVDYDWEEYTAIIESIVYDGATPLTIDNSFSNWDSEYLEDHDGINEFNNTDNDGVSSKTFKYQADGGTVGAEGKNIKIDFHTESMIVDVCGANIPYTFYCTTTGSSDASYSNFASPYKSGKLSWQRDEVYRLFVVFTNDRGQNSFPKWICDLRMPSYYDTVSGVREISDYDAGTDKVSTNVLFPRIQFKSLPAGITSAQIYRVQRERKDRFVVTQGFVIPSQLSALVYRPGTAATSNVASNKLIKLVSPEILINKNVTKGANDFLQYITNYSSSHTEEQVGPFGTGLIHKCLNNSNITYSVNNKTDIDESISIIPNKESIYLNSKDYKNYNNNLGAYAREDGSYGCSGLLITYENANFNINATTHCVVNYKANVYGSQYGGHTYEDRLQNISIPCSDLISTANVYHEVRGGDTYINYFDVASMLADLGVSSVWDDTLNETLYVVLESSINIDLEHSESAPHRVWGRNSGNGSPGDIYLMQEFSGTHVDTQGVLMYNQVDNLYQYNTVYSQQGTVKYAIANPSDKILETEFDCMIKASNKKVNGELSDSWTRFGINEFIEVDSIYGPANAITNFNDKLLFYQDKAFGLLAVNDRSLVNDNASAQLVLGTGGVLDRYDYISTRVGCMDKFSVVSSMSGVFWYDRLTKSLYKYANNLSNLTKTKYMQSYMNTTLDNDFISIAHADSNNDEILFTFFNESATNGFTLSFNEPVDTFVSFYSFVPTIYIPYKHRYLTTTNSYYCGSDFDRNCLFLHDSDTWDRCYFWALTDSDVTKYVDSTIEVLFNPEYPHTKVFDNLFYNSNTYSTVGDIFADTFDSVQCYNDYQNTGAVSLVHKTNLERRERGWTLVVPRNIVNANISTNPNIFTAVDSTQLFKERMRDKYLIAYFTYENDGTYDRFIVNNIGLKYRVSYR
jgi:hypothetical protein